MSININTDPVSYRSRVYMKEPTMTKLQTARRLADQIVEQHRASREYQRKADEAAAKAARAYTGSSMLTLHIHDQEMFAREARAHRDYEHGIWIAARALEIEEEVRSIAISRTER